jgi:hypothetical protein
MIARESLLRKIKVLNERLWEQRAGEPEIDRWLDNFGPDDKDRYRALYILSKFMYIGKTEIVELLHALYRDLLRRPLVQAARESLGHTADVGAIHRRLTSDLRRVRFLGVGSPAESGTHLLYYFRQVNRLPVAAFVASHQILSTREGRPILRTPSVKHYVFIDDLCASGQQVGQYARELVVDMRTAAEEIGRKIEIDYFCLVGTSAGMQGVRRNVDFDRVEAVLELDATYRAFDKSSRYFGPSYAPGLVDCEALCRRFGDLLMPGDPLGYGNSQLLLGFHHNTPDNTLPIFWFDEGNPAWSPIFRRFPKEYGWP